jgi:PAS domain S-box-containing protein
MEPTREEVEQAIASSADAMLVCDPDGRIIGANDPVCRLIGYERSDLLSRTLDELAAPGAPTDEQPLLPALRRDAPLAIETAVRHKDGSPLRLHLSLRPLRMGDRNHSVIRVARRRRASDRLPEEPEFIRALLRTPATLVLSVCRSGKICFASDGFQSRTGLDFAVLRGRCAWELLQDAAEGAALKDAISQPDPSSTLRLTWPAAKGPRKPSVWSVTVLKAIPPAPEYLLLVGRDLSDRRSAGRRDLEKRITELTVQLEQIRAEQEAFTTALAHDLRAPLRAMSGFGDMLIEDYIGRPLDVKGVSFATKMMQAAKRMDQLIEDLLVFNRLSQASVNLGPIALRNLVPEILRSFSTEIQESAAAVEAQVEPVDVIADGILLYLVLCHLVSNALKFVAPGVVPRVTVRAARRGERIRIEVEDNGIGIPSEYVNRIFGVFQRLNRTEAYEGTGMGLAIVRKAVDRMGGRVGLDSEPGKGSRFWVELLAVSTT